MEGVKEAAQVVTMWQKAQKDACRRFYCYRIGKNKAFKAEIDCTSVFQEAHKPRGWPFLCTTKGTASSAPMGHGYRPTPCNGALPTPLITHPPIHPPTHLLDEPVEDDDAHGRQGALDAVLVAIPVIVLRVVAVVLHLYG